MIQHNIIDTVTKNGKEWDNFSSGVNCACIPSYKMYTKLIFEKLFTINIGINIDSILHL